jgi:chromosome segregation ATPase
MKENIGHIISIMEDINCQLEMAAIYGQQLLNENIFLKNKLDSIMLDYNKKELENTKLNEYVLELENITHSVELRNKDLLQAEDERNILKSRVQLLNLQLNDAETNNKNIYIEIDTYSLENKNLEKKLKLSQSEVEDLKKNLVSLQQELSNEINKNNDIKIANELLTKSLDEEKEHRITLKNKLDDLILQVDKDSNNKTILENATGEIDRLRQLVVEMDSNIKNSERVIALINNENNKLKMLISEKEKSKDSSCNDNISLFDQLLNDNNNNNNIKPQNNTNNTNKTSLFEQLINNKSSLYDHMDKCIPPTIVNEMNYDTITKKDFFMMLTIIIKIKLGITYPLFWDNIFKISISNLYDDAIQKCIPIRDWNTWIINNINSIINIY